MTAPLRPSVIPACAAAILGFAACTDPLAPRQEIQTTWPDGNSRIVLGLRAYTGMPWSQVSYNRDEEHGAYRTYHNKGAPAIEGAFEHGTRVGTWSFCSPEGELINVNQNILSDS